MARSFADILEYEGDDFEDTYMLTFNIKYTGPFGEMIEHDLKEDGDNIPVTKENRKVSFFQDLNRYNLILVFMASCHLIEYQPWITLSLTHGSFAILMRFPSGLSVLPYIEKNLDFYCTF